MIVYARINARMLLANAGIAVALLAASNAASAQFVEPASAPILLAEAAAPVSVAAAEAPVASSSSVSQLPDAPGNLALREFVPLADQAKGGTNLAPKYTKSIPADEAAQPITAKDKVIIGFTDLYSVENLLAIVTSAGYEQATNGAPNYGTNGKAFGKRLGAAALRETSQGIFTDVVFSPMLHMDPRYYVQGPQHNFVHRAFYAATRVLVSKTDSGHTTINSPLLLGYAASTAVSYGYYPQINRNFKDSASEYGGSLGGAAVGFLFSEFSDGILRAVHLKK
jgi:hypothetical protein